MKNNNDSDSYEIGYGKPPKHSRFRKGESGNPKGRPKGTLNMATVLERTLRERVQITENGQRKGITKLEAAVKQLVNKAASGDLKAFQQLAALVRAGEERLDVQEPKTEMSQSDQKVMESILRRFESSLKKGNDDAADAE